MSRSKEFKILFTRGKLKWFQISSGFRPFNFYFKQVSVDNLFLAWNSKWKLKGLESLGKSKKLCNENLQYYLTHKVVHLLVYSFVCTHLTFCLSLAEPNHHWALIWSSPASVVSLKYWRTNQLRIVAILRDWTEYFIAGLPKDWFIVLGTSPFQNQSVLKIWWPTTTILKK